MNLFKRFFQEDVRATISAGKLRIDLMQLKNKQSQLEKQKNLSLTELGKKAWAARVRNEGYNTAYLKLEELDTLAANVQKEIEAIQDKIKQETGYLNTTNTGFDARLKDIQTQRQQAMEKLSKLQIIQKDIEQRGTQQKTALTQATTNFQNLSSQINQTQASDQPDKDAKVASLNSTLSAVQSQKDDILSKINVLKGEYESNQGEQAPVKNEIEGYNQQISALQEQNRLAVQPIQEQLRMLNQELVKTNNKKNSLGNQISTLMPEFGSQVYKHRPLSASLKTEYEQVDSVEHDIKAVLDQINLTEASISSVNPHSLRKVAITTGSVVFLIALIAFVIVWVVPTVTTLLTPDPKSNIRVAQNWTLENCTPNQQSDGIYYDIAVWENRKNDSIAYVGTEIKLMGADDIVLDSASDDMAIAPGSVMVTLQTLNSGGSRVQEIKHNINSVYFADASANEQFNKIKVQLYFEKSQYSDNVSLALEIANKSDFGISGNGVIYAFVINKQEKLIDILIGNMSEQNLKIDSMSKVTFQSINLYGSVSCLQGDYTQEEVTFWYFVPLELAGNTDNFYMLSGKADYKP